MSVASNGSHATHIVSSSRYYGVDGDAPRAGSPLRRAVPPLRRATAVRQEIPDTLPGEASSGSLIRELYH